MISARTKQLKINSVLLAGVQIGTVALSFVAVPMTLRYLGLSNYGVWILLLTLVDLLGYLDFGIGHSLRNKYVTAKSKGTNELNKFVSTAFFLFVLISCIFTITVSALLLIVDVHKLLNTPNLLNDNLAAAIILSVGLFSVRFVMNIICIILTAENKPVIPAIVIFTGNLFYLTGIYLISSNNEQSIGYIAGLFYLSQLLPLICMFLYAFNKKYGELYPRISHFSVDHIYKLIDLGGKFFVIQISVLILTQANVIIIAKINGVESLAEFNLAVKYTNVIIIIFTAMLVPLWSATTDAFHKGDLDWIRNEYKRINSLWIYLFAACVTLYVVSSYVYEFWLQGLVRPNEQLLAILLLNLMLLARSTLYRSFTNGVGMIKLQATILSLQAAVHIPLTVFAAEKFGVIGVALVTVMWQLINCIWEPIQFKKILSLKPSGIWTS